MKRMRVVPLITLGLTMLALGGAVVVARAGPREQSIATISGAVTAFGGNLSLAVPPSSASPSIDAATANSIAVAQFPKVKVTGLPPQLAVMSWDAVPVDSLDRPTGSPLYTDVLVWVVSVEGACSQWVSATGDCVNNTTNVVVDASTGKFVVGYAP